MLLKGKKKMSDGFSVAGPTGGPVDASWILCSCPSGLGTAVTFQDRTGLSDHWLSKLRGIAELLLLRGTVEMDFSPVLPFHWRPEVE